MCGSSASNGYERSGTVYAMPAPLLRGIRGEGYAPPRSRLAHGGKMSDFARPRPRAPGPALLGLDGIPRTSIEAHYRLYQGYVAKRNEILGRLAQVDLGSANQVYSDVRSLKVDLTFAVGGIKNHEIYFEHLGGEGSDPDGAIGALVERDFGSSDAWRADLRATGMAGR